MHKQPTRAKLIELLGNYTNFKDFDAEFGADTRISDKLDSFETLNYLMEVEAFFGVKLKQEFFFTEELQTIKNLLSDLLKR